MLDALADWVSDVFESMSSSNQKVEETPAETDKRVSTNNNEKVGIDNPVLELEEVEGEGEVDHYAIIRESYDHDQMTNGIETADEVDTRLDHRPDLDTSSEQYYTYKVPTWLEAPTSNGKL